MTDCDKILIIGLGSEILQDEGIALRITSDLTKSLTHENIRIMNYRMGNLELMHEVKGYDILILIDSIFTGTDAPGTVYSYSPGNFPGSIHLSNYHDAGLNTTLKVAEKIGNEMPGYIRILAVEVASRDQVNERISQELELKYQQILFNIERHIRSLLSLRESNISFN